MGKGSSSPFAEGMLAMVENPLDSDVLCGKNKECLSHPGSIEFREHIERYVDKYEAADSKYMKMEITKQIYQDWRQQSKRFLKYSTEEGVWQELPVSSVRDKIGHALRFAKKRRDKRGKEATSNRRHRRAQSDSAVLLDAGHWSASLVKQPAKTASNMGASGSDGIMPDDGHYRPVTKVMEQFSASLPHMPKPFPVTSGCLPDRKLSDGEVLSILREPLVDFEPQKVNQITPYAA